VIVPAIRSTPEERRPALACNKSRRISKDKPETIIQFKLVVSRTSSTRYLPIENEDDGEKLFKTITEFFGRYDRLIKNPVLECVIVGETECRCVYNAKELHHFLLFLRRSGHEAT
jgi:hypothetical protein